MEEIAVRAEGLEKVYGEGDVQVRAVDGVDLEVRRGEVVLIMGPSGSGKTTLLSMLGAMLRPTSGRVLVDGTDLTALPEKRLPDFRARRFGFVFQDFNLLANLTARENVQLPMDLAGVPRGESRERASRILSALGLRERLEFLPEKLSGGEKQRVSIARALANRPRVLLADEPTANLDSRMGKAVAGVFRRLARAGRTAVLMVSHDSRIVDAADRVLLMEDGRLTAMT